MLIIVSTAEAVAVAPLVEMRPRRAADVDTAPALAPTAERRVPREAAIRL